MMATKSGLGHPTECCGFRDEFGQRALRGRGEAAGAMQSCANTTREEAPGVFVTDRLAAVGAKWLRGSHGDGWGLYKAEYVETEAAMRELLEYLGVPGFMPFCRCPQQTVNVRACASFLKFGLTLDMEHLKQSAEAECPKCKADACPRWERDASKAKNGDGGTGGGGSDAASSFFHLLKDYIRCFFEKVFRHKKSPGSGLLW